MMLLDHIIKNVGKIVIGKIENINYIYTLLEIDELLKSKIKIMKINLNVLIFMTMQIHYKILFSVIFINEVFFKLDFVDKEKHSAWTY